MLTKSVSVDIDFASFPGCKIPPILKTSSPVPIDIKKALFMLGELTIPNGISRASPAQSWAWIRYFSAVAVSSDLRITEPFGALDPHQKGVLSDDFGVALNMCWLMDRLGGFAEVVDGRRFVLQFKQYLNKPKKKTPKVGRGKCPDFVVRDNTGKWHTIECKGTQSSSTYRNQQMKVAILQKRCVDIVGSKKGYSLAAGIYLAAENDLVESTNMLIVDPEVDPYVTIDASTLSEAKEVTRRLAVSRALGLAGIGRLSEELSLPREAGEFQDLYTPGERARLSRPRETRTSEAVKEVRSGAGRTIVSNNVRYRGRSIDVEIPGDEFRSNTNGCTRIRVEHGVSEEFVDAMASSEDDIFEMVDIEADRFLSNAAIELKSTPLTATLRQGEFFFANMELLP